MQPWIIPSLKQVVFSPDDLNSSNFVHLSTVGNPSAEPQSIETGHAVWLSLSTGQPAAIAWEWVILDHGCVALLDPMAIVTNICIEHGAGLVDDPIKTAIHLNRIVHALHWQAHALRAFRKVRRDGLGKGQCLPVRSWAHRRHRALACTSARV